MAAKMKDSNKPPVKKKKKEDPSTISDADVAQTKLDGDDADQQPDSQASRINFSSMVSRFDADHLNGDVHDADADPYEWDEDQDERDNSGNPDDRRRQIRNKTEKQRKDKIRSWIGRISDLIPGCGDRLGGSKKQQSMNVVLEKSYDYMLYLRDQNQALLVGKGNEAQATEIIRLKKQLAEVTEERDTFAALLKESKKPDAARLWNERLANMKIHPENMDLTKLIKCMRKPSSLETITSAIQNRDVTSNDPCESESESARRRKRKLNEFRSDVNTDDPLIDCNGESDGAMFSPQSDISNVTSVDMPTHDGDGPVTSSHDLIGQPQVLMGNNATALQTLASVASTEMVACDTTAQHQSELAGHQNEALLQATNSGTFVTQAVNMPIMSTSHKSSAGQIAGTQLAGNIIMQNGQLIVLSEPVTSEGRRKSPQKSKDDQDLGSEALDSSQLAIQLANQQMNHLGLTNQTMPLLAGGQSMSGMAQTMAASGIHLNPGALNLSAMQQQGGLPQALILPDGRIIPVVTQPNLMFPAGQAINGQPLILPGSQNLYPGVTTVTSQGQQQTATTGAGLPNFDLQQAQLGLNSQIIGQPQVGMPMPYVMTSDGQMIQSLSQPGLNHFNTVHNQFANFSNAAKTSTTNVLNHQRMADGSIILNSQNAPVSGPQHVQVITSNGTFMLQLPPGAQGQQLLLDPNTLQPILPQQKPIVPAQQPTTTTSTASTGSKKSNKKGHRVLMPKPPQMLQAGGVAAQNFVQIHPVVSERQPTTPMAAMMGDDAKKASGAAPAPPVSTAQEMDSTDILAKAAGEIFSGDMGEFCDEKTSDEPAPMESKKRRKKKNVKSSAEVNADVMVSSESQTLPNSTLPLMSIAEDCSVITDHSGVLGEPSKRKSKKKSRAKEKLQKEMEKTDPIDPNSLPDTITFDENDLSAVLDQVEKINVPEGESPEKKSRKTKMFGHNEPDKKKRKQDKENTLDFDLHDDPDPGLQIVLDPPSLTSPQYTPVSEPEMISPKANDAPFSQDNRSSDPFARDDKDPFARDDKDQFARDHRHDDDDDARPSKDATLKAVDNEESRDNAILDTIHRIMDSPISAPPATPSADMQLEKDHLLTDNLNLLSSMAAADREHDRTDESAAHNKLFPDLSSKEDERIKDRFSPFNFAESPTNFDIDKRKDHWKDLSPTSSTSAPLLTHSVEALFSSGKQKDKDSIPGGILSQLNSPIEAHHEMETTKLDEMPKTFPAQHLLPELDAKPKEKMTDQANIAHKYEARSGFFTSEGLVQHSKPKEIHQLTNQHFFNNNRSENKVVQKSESKAKEKVSQQNQQNFYRHDELTHQQHSPENAFSDKDVSEFARNSPPCPPSSITDFFNPPARSNNSSAFSLPTSSVAPFSFCLTSTATSTSGVTTTVPSSNALGSHQFPFYPLHPSLSTGNQSEINLNLPFSDGGRDLTHNVPASLANNMQPARYPNYGMGQMAQHVNRFVEPQPKSCGPSHMMPNRFPQPRRSSNDMQPRPPFVDQSAPPFDMNAQLPSRMPRLPNQFSDMGTNGRGPQRQPETSSSPTMPTFGPGPSMPGCEMGGTKNRTPDCNRPSPGEIRNSRRHSDGSHIGTSPRMPDLIQSPRLPEINQSPRLADLNQSPRLSDINQSPRLSDLTQSPRVSDQSPGRADSKRLVEHGSQQRPRSGPGQPPPNPLMFYQPPGFAGPPNPMSSPPLHHPNRPPEISPNFETPFNAPTDFNPVLNFGASGFDPPALELTSSTATSTTQSTTFSRPNSQPMAPSSKPRERAPAKQRAPATPKPKAKPKPRKSNKPYEMDTNLSNSIFETGGRSITPYLPFTSMPSPPPSRNDAPTYIGMPFGPARPLSNTSLMQHKPGNPEMNTFNPLLPATRPQNGLGFNFQTGFGMNHMPPNAQPLPPHANNGSMVTPHMPNFSLSNIFSDMGQGQDSLNISPIKLPHGNSFLPQTSMDHPMQHHHHHHQAGIYHHQRGHQQMIHNMSINSLLGHNPHGFDGRGMGAGPMGPPFHGPGSAGTFGMPPLNFNMHDH